MRLNIEEVLLRAIEVIVEDYKSLGYSETEAIENAYKRIGISEDQLYDLLDK